MLSTFSFTGKGEWFLSIRAGKESIERQSPKAVFVGSSSRGVESLVAVGEVDALAGINSGGVLALSVAGQRGSPGSSDNSSVDSGVGVAVRVVGAGLGVHSSRVLVTSGLADWGSLVSLCLLRGSWGWGPLLELSLDVVGGEVPGGSGVPLRLGNRGGLPLLGSGGGVPLRLRSGGRLSGEAGVVPALIVLTLLNDTGSGSVDRGVSVDRGSGGEGSGDSGNGMGIPQGIIVDGKGGRLSAVQLFVIAHGVSGTGSGVHASRELGRLLGRHRHEGHRHKGLEEYKKGSTLGDTIGTEGDGYSTRTALGSHSTRH